MSKLITYTDDQENQIIALARKYAVDDVPSTLRSPSNYNLKSYTLRHNVNRFFINDLFFKQTLNILQTFHPILTTLISQLFVFQDRSGDSRVDPLFSTPGIQLAYIPKGLTDFAPEDKTTFSENLTGKIRREVLRLNNGNPGCPETDKSITIKVYKSNDYLHIYFNKYSESTIGYIILIAFRYGYQLFIDKTIFKDDAATIDNILLNALFPNKDSATNILNLLTAVLDKRTKAESENLAENFSSILQANLNQNGRQTLERNLQRAQDDYTTLLENLASYATRLKEAQQCMTNYNEIDFSAIRVFLTKIKQYPNTKYFNKYDKYSLMFIIEEPILFTEDKVWSKYITNTYSNLRERINSTARQHYDDYETTRDILDFSIQRLFKAVFVDQTIKLFTASAMYLDQRSSYFNIKKTNLPDPIKYFPHPHLGAHNLTCWGNAHIEITKAIMGNNGETAFTQMIYAFQQVTASDGAVVNILLKYLLDTEYHDLPIFQKADNTERITFKDIIKEYVQDETNKINASNNPDNTTGI